MKIVFTCFFLLLLIFHPLYAQKPRVIYNHTNVESGLNYDQIEYILIDKDGFIWVNTDLGLNRIDSATQKVERFYGNYKGRIIYDKAAHALWIADTVLKKFDINTLTLETFKSHKNIRAIHAIIMDENGKIWLGTDKGLLIFDKKENTYAGLPELLLQGKKKSKHEYEWSSNPVTSLYEDYRRHIWLGIEKSIYVINTQDGSYNIFKHETENENSILDETITGIYGNRQGTVLITNTTTEKFSSEAPMV